MKKSKPTSKAPLEKQHDRPKNRMVETLGKKYLHALKITDDRGNVLKNAQDKYRQIDKYVEILSGLVKNAPLEKLKNIADMGAGKGYLTFALADYLKEKGIGAKITGVEYREDLVNLCNQISAESGFENLSFVQGTIENYDASGVNLLIALHACDTATDDAIAKGIQAGAEWIVVAPCCHKQVRREMEKNNIHGDFSFLTRHGIFLERQAEMATDGIRALVLEYFGYRVKVFEFISDSHTPKNVMIVAAKNPKAVLKSDVVLQKISSAKNCLGIGRHYLEKIL